MTFTSPFSQRHCESHGKAPTPIELIQGPLFPQLIAQDLTCVIHVCWDTGGLSSLAQPLSAFHTEPASISAGADIMQATQLSRAET